MPFSPITHHMTRVAESQLYKINRVTPIVRLGQLSDVVLLQGGQSYSEDGAPCELPGWAYAAMARLTPAALKDAGFDAAPEPPAGVLVPEPMKEVLPAMWQCPACNRVLDEGARESHIAKHNVRLAAEHQLGADGKPKH